MIVISAVSAVDVDCDETAIEDHANDEVISDDVGSGDFSTLRNAMYRSNNVSLSGDITRSASDSVIDIYEGRSFSIDGNGHTINANRLGRVFQILPGGQLTLKNLKIINGNLPSTLATDFDGGAILNMGTLYIENCEFTNNYARDGGAIACDREAYTYLSGTNIFQRNSVWQDGGAISNGGGSTLIITGKNTFHSNSANYNGAAAITIDEGKGGAIMNVFASINNPNKKSYLYIEGETIFSNNEAKADGGAIFNHQAIANLTGTTIFLDNKGVYERSKGGAINNENATFYLGGVNTFKSNRAYRGGAIDSNMFESVFTITGKNEFSSNFACMGGAISNEQGIAFNLYGENTFLSNKADYYGGQSRPGENIGGAIYSYASRLNIDGKNTFSGNSAVGPGGAIYSANNNARISGVNTFNSNSASDGAAIIFLDSTRVDLLGENNFIANSASSTGGAIRANNLNELIIYNHNYFSNNRASKSGGAVYVQNSAFNSQGSLYDTNTANQGGAIFLENSAFAGNYNIFKNNRATTSGSDIESYQSSINSLEYNYWNSQNKVGQGNINGYSVSNINNWVVLDLTVPSQIKQEETTELVRFKSNTLSNLNGEMPSYTVSASPNFEPSTVAVQKNVGTSKYVGPAGQVEVKVSSSNFDASRTVNVISMLISTTLTANDVLLYPGDTGNYVVTLKDKNGKALPNQNIRIAFNGKVSTLLTDDKGQVSLPVSGSTGHYPIDAFFDGKDNYLSSNKSNYVVVLSDGGSNTQIKANNISMLYHDGTRFVATVTDMNDNVLKNVEIGFMINNVSYLRKTNDNGQASIPLNLPANTYNVVSYFIGDGNYLPAIAENTVVIGSTISASDVVKYYKNATQYEATFLNSDGSYLAKGTKVTFNINGKLYSRSIRDDRGNTVFDINLGPGKYILTATNTNGENIASNIEVLTIFAEHNNVVKYYKNGTQYYVSLLDGSGNPMGAGAAVEFNINGVFYTRYTNASGVAKMNINLREGDYIITAKYNGLAVSNRIKVLPIMFGSDLIKRYGDDGAFEVRLINGTGDNYPGQTITFNINGVFYNRTTNDEGIAKLNIRLLSGEYIITSEYDGFLISNKVTVTS